MDSPNVCSHRVAAGGDYDLHSSSTPVSLPARMVRTEEPNSGGRREIEIRPEAAPGTDMSARRTATRTRRHDTTDDQLGSSPKVRADTGYRLANVAIARL